MVMRLMTSMVVRSSTNLNRSSSGTQSALLFVWDKNSQFPSVAPMAPPPGNCLGAESFPCQRTRISLFWKQLINNGIRDGRTPLFINDCTPRVWHSLRGAFAPKNCHSPTQRNLIQLKPSWSDIIIGCYPPPPPPTTTTQPPL